MTTRRVRSIRSKKERAMNSQKNAVMMRKLYHQKEMHLIMNIKKQLHHNTKMLREISKKQLEYVSIPREPLPSNMLSPQQLDQENDKMVDFEEAPTNQTTRERAAISQTLSSIQQQIQQQQVQLDQLKRLNQESYQQKRAETLQKQLRKQYAKQQQLHVKHALQKHQDSKDRAKQYTNWKQAAHYYAEHQQYELATIYYEKLIHEFGDLDAYFHMGIRYLKGIGAPINLKKAWQYFCKLYAAYVGNCTLLTTLATSFLHGHERTKINEMCHQTLLQCHKSGYVEATYTLGVMYRDAIAVPKNDMLAFYYFFSAVKKCNHPSSLNNIGLMISQGFGQVEPDYDMAYHFIKMAADMKERKGCFNVALLLESGQGCERNLQKSLSYFEEAVTLGFPLAQERLNHVTETILNEQSSIALI